MFLCEKCAPEQAKWLFGLPMGISFGPCESCRKSRECIDWHGNLDRKRRKDPPLDTFKYDKK